MLSQYSERLPQAQEVLDQLRSLRELLAANIEVLDFKSLPLKTMSSSEFLLAFGKQIGSKKELGQLIDQRPDLQLGSFVHEPALILLPDSVNPIGLIAVITRLQRSEDPYTFGCRDLYVLNSRRKAISFRNVIPSGYRLAISLTEQASFDDESWQEGVMSRFAFDPPEQKIILGEIRQFQHLKVALHESGHAWAFHSKTDRYSPDQSRLRDSDVDLWLDQKKGARKLKLPPIYAVQEISYSERLASVIARLTMSGLEKVGFIDQVDDSFLEPSLQTYDVAHARFILENYPEEASKLFASKYARSPKGLAQSGEILQATNSLEHSVLAKIATLGKPTQTKRHFFGNRREEIWEKTIGDENYLIVIWRTSDRKFISVEFQRSRETGDEYDQPWSKVEVNHFFGATVYSGDGDEDGELILEVAAGMEVPDYRVKLARVQELLQQILAKFELR